MKSLECTNCGAPLKKNCKQCVYCGTSFENVDGSERSVYRRVRALSIFHLPMGVGEFGLSGNLFVTAGVVIAFILYALGWWFEDTTYWLNATAMTIWVGIMPLWLFGVALLWKATGRAVLIGLAWACLVFAIHILVIWVIRGNLWDDHVGIAGLIAGASLISWMIGRLGHSIIRLKNARTNKENV